MDPDSQASTGSPERSATPTAAWADGSLVSSCLEGDEDAWRALVAKYQTLVFTIIVHSGAAQGEEGDVLQAVWLDVFNELHGLRKRESLKAWIVTVTRHKCHHWRLRRQRLPVEMDESWAERLPDRAELPLEVLARLERQQELREAIQGLPTRCRTLLTRLFLEDPPRPYAEVAAELGLAEGSIGAQRSRCLAKLRSELRRRRLTRSPRATSLRGPG